MFNMHIFLQMFGKAVYVKISQTLYIQDNICSLPEWPKYSSSNVEKGGIAPP